MNFYLVVSPCTAMSMQKFWKLKETWELLNGLESDDNDLKVVVLPSDATEPTDENE